MERPKKGTLKGKFKKMAKRKSKNNPQRRRLKDTHQKFLKIPREYLPKGSNPLGPNSFLQLGNP